MLKIKDDVTYQKLNAIGFRLDNFNECYVFEYGCDVSICVYKNNKEIWTYIEEGYEYRELAYEGYTTIEELKEYCPKLVRISRESRGCMMKIIKFILTLIFSINIVINMKLFEIIEKIK